MKKIIVVCDFAQADLVLYALNIAEEEFQIVKMYGVGERKSCNYEIEPAENIIDIQKLEYDFILVVCLLQDMMKKTLTEKLFLDRVIDKNKFAKLFLSEEKRMECYRKKIEIAYKKERIHEKIIIGDFTYGTPIVYADNPLEKAVIGKFCSIASGVTFLLRADHRCDWITTYPFNVLLEEFSFIQGHPASKGDIVIGNDVWIASDAKIMSGVRVGDGCVIGTGAIVTHDIPDYSIAVGNPAKIVKKRFDEETIEKLQKMKWWDWEYADIYRVIPLLQSNHIDQLVEYWTTQIVNR